MGWSKEEFWDFCKRAGVDPETGLRLGVVNLNRDTNPIKSAKTRRKRKEAHANRIGITLPPPKPECLPEMALVEAQGRADQGPLQPDRRIRVGIEIKRILLADHDNSVGGTKALVDGLREIGLIPEDDPGAIDLQVTQSKTTSLARTGVTITLDYPDQNETPAP